MSGDAPRAVQIHVQLMDWLRTTHPRAPVEEVLAALTYEVGRLLGQVTTDADDAAVDEALEDVRRTMRKHITAYRRGLRF